MRHILSTWALVVGLLCWLAPGTGAQIPATKGLAVNPTTLKLVPDQVDFFVLNSNDVHRALGLANIPAALNLRTRWVPTIADLVSIDTSGISDGSIVLVGARAETGDGAGGEFQWRRDSQATANDATIYEGPESTGRWHRNTHGIADPRWWGAKGDGTTSDTVAFQAAMDWAAGLVPVKFTQGTYQLDGPLRFNHDFQEIQGDGYTSILRVAHAGNGFEHLGVTSGQPRRYGLKFKNFRMVTAAGTQPASAFRVDDVSYSVWEETYVTAGSGPGFWRAWSSFGHYDLDNQIYGGNWGNTIRLVEWYNRAGGDWVIHSDGGPGSTGGANDIRILDSYIAGGLDGAATNGATGAIYLNNLNMARVVNCDMEQYSTNGVWVGSRVQSVSILNNRFEIQGGTTATRRCIHFDEYTTQGHVVSGNMMLIQGAGGSLTRISGPEATPGRIPATILDPSFEGANQILTDTLLVGLELDNVARTYGPAGNKLIVMNTTPGGTNSIGVGTYDGTVNPRLFLSQIGENDNRILSASSQSSIPLSFYGSGLMAQITATGSSFLGLPAPLAAVTAHGSFVGGPNPGNGYVEGYTPVNQGVYLRSTNNADRIGFFAQTVDGLSNRRFSLDVDNGAGRVVLSDGYTTGGGRIEFESGNVTSLRVSDSAVTALTPLVAAQGISVSDDSKIDLGHGIRIWASTNSGVPTLHIRWANGTTNAIAVQP